MDNFGELQQLWDRFIIWAGWVDWRGHLMAVIQWIDWTLLIDAFGLTLAIIGFFNLTPKLEAHFRYRMEYAEAGLEVMTERFRLIWPIHRNWRLFWNEIIQTLCSFYREILFSIAFAVPVTIAWEGWERFASNFTRFHWGWFVAAPFLYLAAVFLFIAVTSILRNRYYYITSWIGYHILRILSTPPSGVLGSIGLLIAGVSLVLNRLP